jgi:hypothetical protein
MISTENINPYNQNSCTLATSIIDLLKELQSNEVLKYRVVELTFEKSHSYFWRLGYGLLLILPKLCFSCFSCIKNDAVEKLWKEVCEGKKKVTWRADIEDEIKFAQISDIISQSNLLSSYQLKFIDPQKIEYFTGGFICGNDQTFTNQLLKGGSPWLINPNITLPNGEPIIFKEGDYAIPIKIETIKMMIPSHLLINPSEGKKATFILKNKENLLEFPYPDIEQLFFLEMEILKKSYGTYQAGGYSLQPISHSSEETSIKYALKQSKYKRDRYPMPTKIFLEKQNLEKLKVIIKEVSEAIKQLEFEDRSIDNRYIKEINESIKQLQFQDKCIYRWTKDHREFEMIEHNDIELKQGAVLANYGLINQTNQIELVVDMAGADSICVAFFNHYLYAYADREEIKENVIYGKLPNSMVNLINYPKGVTIKDLKDRIISYQNGQLCINLLL